jgi:hypothetical protein
VARWNRRQGTSANLNGPQGPAGPFLGGEVVRIYTGLSVEPLSQSLKQVIESWQEGGVDELWPPATPERIHAVLRDIGQKASADVIELYTTTGGFGGVDKHAFRLWSLDEILKENTAHRGARWFFADVMIESFRFQLQFENELVSSVWSYCGEGEDLNYQIADSLAHFFEIYLTDPGSIWLLDGGGSV